MFKWIFNILKNESGIDPITGGALILGGSTLLGGLLGKNKQKTIDPYSGLRGTWQNWLQSKIGTSTPYKYNEAFNLDQPEVEGAVERTILGKLNNLPRIQGDIKGVSEQYYNAQKAQKKERFSEEAAAQKDMYNRLGLSSSSPYLAGSDELTRKQGQEYDVLEADVARQGIDQEMRATALAEEIANQYLSQGQVLGQAQRGYQQYGQKMSMADIERMVAEEMGYGEQAAGVLGGNPPQTYFKPNIWSQLASAGQGIGTSLISGGMMSGGNVLGGGGAGTTAGISTSNLDMQSLMQRYPYLFAGGG